MANEITLDASLVYDDAEDATLSIAIADLLASVSSKKFSKVRHNVGTSEEAMYLGEVSSLGWCMVVNRDATNYVELRTSTGGTKFAKLAAGQFCLFRFGSGITAPYIIADTAACDVEYLVISN